MLPSERPDDALLEDDEALDKWHENFVREQALKYTKQAIASQKGNAAIPQFTGV